jgi:hypothetical protein
MTEHDHDDIARRLRESGTVPAPERLRGEVMDQVRAEPRLRRSRRWFLTPALPYAAAAAVIAVIVLAISHAGGGGSGPASFGDGASGGGAERAPTATGDKAAGPPASRAEGDQSVFHVSPGDALTLSNAQGVTTRSPGARTVVLVVPPSRYAAYKKRLRSIERRGQGEGSIRVILKPAS